MWGTIAGILYRLLGIPQLIALWEAKRAGRAAQKAADDAATIQQATEARQIDAAVAGDSDAAVNAKLRAFSKPE